ncbi:translation initiation factor IF-2 [Triticum aestivum]|uniref:translation initiation factor IF-2 n=1 Tax=Triticum aestivum TaxID=4565 RepID=UPI001D0155BB|nr:translation initiation factor IF-2-like [Triticum aestivum]
MLAANGTTPRVLPAPHFAAARQKPATGPPRDGSGPKRPEQPLAPEALPLDPTGSGERHPAAIRTPPRLLRFLHSGEPHRQRAPAQPRRTTPRNHHRPWSSPPTAFFTRSNGDLPDLEYLGLFPSFPVRSVAGSPPLPLETDGSGGSRPDPHLRGLLRSSPTSSRRRLAMDPARAGARGGC